MHIIIETSASFIFAVLSRLSLHRLTTAFIYLFIFFSLSKNKWSISLAGQRMEKKLVKANASNCFPTPHFTSSALKKMTLENTPVNMAVCQNPRLSMLLVSLNLITFELEVLHICPHIAMNFSFCLFFSVQSMCSLCTLMRVPK